MGGVHLYSQFPASYISQSRNNTEVYWGHSSILEAELFCLQDLLQSNKSWEYAIDLTGSEVEDRLRIDELVETPEAFAHNLGSSGYSVTCSAI